MTVQIGGWMGSDLVFLVVAAAQLSTAGLAGKGTQQRHLWGNIGLEELSGLWYHETYHIALIYYVNHCKAIVKLILTSYDNNYFPLYTKLGTR